MTRLIAAAALIIAITAPAFACEWNKSAGRTPNRPSRRNPAGHSRASQCSNTSAPSAHLDTPCTEGRPRVPHR